MDNPMLLNFGGYLAGVLIHVGSKWTDWYQETGAWGTFWQKQAGLTVRNGIGALVLFGVWQTGALSAAVAAMTGSATELPINFATSAFAGYALDSLGKNLIPAAKP